MKPTLFVHPLAVNKSFVILAVQRKKERKKETHPFTLFRTYCFSEWGGEISSCFCLLINSLAPWDRRNEDIHRPKTPSQMIRDPCLASVAVISKKQELKIHSFCFLKRFLQLLSEWETCGEAFPHIAPSQATVLSLITFPSIRAFPLALCCTQTHTFPLSLYSVKTAQKTACCWPSSPQSRWLHFGTTWPTLRRWGELFKRKKTFNLL